MFQLNLLCEECIWKIIFSFSLHSQFYARQQTNLLDYFFNFQFKEYRYSSIVGGIFYVRPICNCHKTLVTKILFHIGLQFIICHPVKLSNIFQIQKSQQS